MAMKNFLQPPLQAPPCIWGWHFKEHFTFTKSGISEQRPVGFRFYLPKFSRFQTTTLQLVTAGPFRQVLVFNLLWHPLQQQQLLIFKGVISSIKVICKLDGKTTVSCHDTRIYFAAQTQHLLVVYHSSAESCSASPITQATGTAGSLTVSMSICSPGLLTVVQVARKHPSQKQ